LKEFQMKRMFWIVTLALAIGFGAAGIGIAPVLADGGSSGSGSGSEVRTEINLTGAAINGVLPKGRAEYRVGVDYRKFKVQVEQVRLPDGTTLNIAVNGSSVGMLMLTFGRGELERSTKDGQRVPFIKSGDIVTATTATGRLVLQGKF
jgi:hypothetical protein